MIDVIRDRVSKAFIERLELFGTFDGFKAQLFRDRERSRSVVGGLDRLVVSPRFGVRFRAEEDPFALAVFFPTIYNPFRC